MLTRFAAKRKQEELAESDTNKRFKAVPLIRLTSQTKSDVAFTITERATIIGRNTPELQRLVNNDKFVSREACTIVARSDGNGAVLTAVCSH